MAAAGVVVVTGLVSELVEVVDVIVVPGLITVTVLALGFICLMPFLKPLAHQVTNKLILRFGTT